MDAAHTRMEALLRGESLVDAVATALAGGPFSTPKSVADARRAMFDPAPPAPSLVLARGAISREAAARLAASTTWAHAPTPVLAAGSLITGVAAPLPDRTAAGARLRAASIPVGTMGAWRRRAAASAIAKNPTQARAYTSVELLYQDGGDASLDAALRAAGLDEPNMATLADPAAVLPLHSYDHDATDARCSMDLEFDFAGWLLGRVIRPVRDPEMLFEWGSLTMEATNALERIVGKAMDARATGQPAGDSVSLNDSIRAAKIAYETLNVEARAVTDMLVADIARISANLGVAGYVAEPTAPPDETAEQVDPLDAALQRALDLAMEHDGFFQNARAYGGGGGRYIARVIIARAKPRRRGDPCE